MKISDLDITNVRGVAHVRIQPGDEPTILVTGANGQGKSSTLDAIWLALGGRKALNASPHVVRDGEQTAEVRLTLDGDDGNGLVVVRRWIGDKTTLDVRDERGFKASAAQSALDALVGNMTFDPLGWLRESDTKQREMLLAAVNLPFDLAEVEERKTRAFAERTEINRQVRQMEARVGGMEAPPDGTPDEEVSVTDLLAQLEKARAAEADADRLRNAYDEALRGVSEAGAEIDRLKIELAASEARHVELVAEAERAGKAMDDAPPVNDETGGLITAGLLTAIGEAEAVNAAVRAGAARRAAVSELTQLAGQADALSEQLLAIDKEKRAGLAAATMPLDGMSITDDGVLFNGRPLRQCSTSEQLRVSVATAMATNPKVKIVRIANGNDLDSTNLQLVSDLVEQNGYQAWIEMVDETGERGFHIVAGELTSTPADR